MPMTFHVGGGEKEGSKMPFAVLARTAGAPSGGALEHPSLCVP